MKTKPVFLIRLFALLFTLLATAPTRALETVLLGDQFADDERATQTLPRTAQWFYAGQAGAAARLWVTPPAGGGQLRMIASGSASAMALAYFTAAGAPQTLAAGESITLEFTAKLDALRNADANLRVMLFNSAASRPAADNEAGTFGETATYANKYDGYTVALNTGATTDSFNLYKRRINGSGMPFSLGTLMGADNPAALNLKVKQAFVVKLKYTRSTGAGSIVAVEATVNGVVVTRTDSASILTSFDGCGFYLGDALGSEQALAVDNLTVKHTTAAAVTSTLLDDTFADNNRANQALPGSAHWFYAGSSVASERLTTAAPVSAENLVLTPGGQAAMALAYFTPSGAPQALAIGESITFQANVHLDVLGNAADGIRFGLFNSGGSRVSADFEGGVNPPAPSPYDAYRGYSVWLNPGASGAFNSYRRDGSALNPFSASASTIIGNSSTADLALSTAPESVPRFIMTITRLSSGMQIDASINGRTLIRTESVAAAATAFDTAAIFFSSAALYEGAQAVFDEVTVVHSGIVPTVPSAGKIFSQTFDAGTAWAGASFVGTVATGAVSSGTFGTITVVGRVNPSAGRKLDVNSTGLSGYWSGALNSGLIAVTNSETNLGKLTLAFDLRASAARAVRVRIESADAGGVVGGAREKMIYPAVAGSFQRYAFELADMTAAGGTFSPTAPNVKLTFQIEGGVDAGSWPAGAHSLQIDNVYYARPAFYVKPGGTGNGLTEATPFGSIAAALSAANAGDIIVVMEAATNPATTPAFTLTSGLSFTRGGTPGGWVTLKNYPGQRPLIQGGELSYNVIAIGKGFNGSIDYTSELNYIEVRGLRLRGTADTLPVADRGTATSKSNVNGISADGRYMMKPPHHLRFADLEVFNLSGGGATVIEGDYWFLEGNDIHDNCNWMIYAGSGISALTPWNFDGTAGTHRIFWLGNRSYRNETKEPWEATGAISDGNGAILDTFIETRRGLYLGRSIVANNLLYENGGSGIHAFKANCADIVNNTAVRNSHSPALNYGNIYGGSSNDLVIANNIIVASAGEELNESGYSTAFPRTTGIQFRNNLYLSDGGTVAPYVDPDPLNNSGNITTTDVKFVDAATGDFRLKTGSPAFDAALGTLSFLPIRDFHGILRRTDGSPDIGACERQPAIVVAPVAQTGVVGNSVTLSVAAQSAGPNSALSYQWQRNGSNLAGATSAQLTLANLTTAQAGDYRALVSAGSPAFDTFTSPAATLTVWTQLQNWRSQNFGTIANTGSAADTADPDFDGIFNLDEYALNLGPNLASQTGLPTFLRDVNGRLKLTFLRARSDVTYRVEGSSNLTQWSTIATNPGSVGQTVTVTDSALATEPRRFLRLQILNP